jgi:hypothetical protein
MPRIPFAGAHSAGKLDGLAAYLKAYLTVLKKQDWVHTIYFDAFAGTGTAAIAPSAERPSRAFFAPHAIRSEANGRDPGRPPLLLPSPRAA